MSSATPPVASKDSAAVANAARAVAFRPIIQEQEIKQETISLTVVPKVGPESWDLHILEGKGPSGRAGRITIGSPDYPSAVLSWFEDRGEIVIHNIWVEEDIRRCGVARTLMDAFRRNVHPKTVFVGPYSKSGLETAQKLSDEVRASNTEITRLAFIPQQTPSESPAKPNIPDEKVAQSHSWYKTAKIVESKRSEIRTLKDNRLTLTDEERKQVMDAKAVWHHGPNGEESPSVWKSKNSKGEILFVTNTHRAYQTAKTLEECIRLFHEVIEETA